MADGEPVVPNQAAATRDRMEIDDEPEEKRSLFGRPAGPRVFHLEVRYLAVVTGVLLGLYCGRHLVSSHATAPVASTAPPLLPRALAHVKEVRAWTHVKEVGPDAAQPPEAQPPPDARPPAKGAEPVKESWPEVRARILKAQIKMEADAKKTKAMPIYAGPRVLGYLYVGPGHVVKDLKGSLQVPLALRCAAACALRVYACTLHAYCMYAIHTLQPGNVTERECATHCTANPKCKGFAWCAQAEALPKPKPLFLSAEPWP